MVTVSNRIYKQRCVQALFPESLWKYFKNIICDFEEIAEIRIRRNGPVQIIKRKQSIYIDSNGCYCRDATAGIVLTSTEFDMLFRHICRHSVYAFEEELKNGYLTVEGGHRIGIVGQTVWADNHLNGIKNINALNIRIAHEIKGIADRIIPYIISEHELKSTLIVSLPGRGKTTLLRDLVRQTSNGNANNSGKTVSLIDERSELASCYLGVAQNDVGMHTDILDACPKATGIMMVLRSMSPQVIAVDELGSAKDYEAIQQAFYLGCKILATIHGESYKQIKQNTVLSNMLSEGGFERLIFLESTGAPGERLYISNQRGEVIKKW